MTATTVIATYAAVLTTLNIGWIIYRDVRSGHPRIDFEVFSGSPSNDDMWATIAIVIHNRGSDELPMPRVSVRCGDEEVWAPASRRTPNTERLPAHDSRLIHAVDVPFPEGQKFYVEAEVEGKTYRSKSIPMYWNKPRLPLAHHLEAPLMAAVTAEPGHIDWEIHQRLFPDVSQKDVTYMLQFLLKAGKLDCKQRHWFPAT